MIYGQSIYADEDLYRLKAGLEALSGRYRFEYEIVNMNEIELKLKEEDDVLKILSESEFKHYSSLKLPKNRIQWLAGRYAVKSALFKYKLGGKSLMNLNCIDVLKGYNSAPYIMQYPGIVCSISHSSPYCVGVVSDKRIGIDIEKVAIPEDSLIRYFYSKNEKDVLKNCKDKGEYSIRAMSFWTRKEAVSKLLGLGMKMNFKELDTAEEKIQLSLLPDKDIVLASIDSGNYCLSLAV